MCNVVLPTHAGEAEIAIEVVKAKGICETREEGADVCTCVMLQGCPSDLGVTLTVPVQEKGSVLVPLGENVVQDLQGETLEVTKEPSIPALAGSVQGCLTVEGWDGPFGRATSADWFPATKALVLCRLSNQGGPHPGLATHQRRPPKKAVQKQWVLPPPLEI